MPIQLVAQKTTLAKPYAINIDLESPSTLRSHILHEINSNDDNPNVSYNTRVERAEKRYDLDGKETGRSLTLKKVHRNRAKLLQDSFEEGGCAFNATIVASGRFSAPKLPRILGVAQWAQLHPHSKMFSTYFESVSKFSYLI
ncbi:hypothetical protein F5878DRAFT_691721 [Lentinula raphanica]|uniref:FAD/NAD(P)-binding domain-containing protein n=1 Tax=Lentinula raphanica TaxID=153919 RepID=A0AA38P3S0_9AGAR|nr:hypothetical protein F5878DRAFT_691721 [Lentinula raphanica]